MRVIVDADRCIGSGMCVLAAPEVFDQDEAGVVRLRTDHPEPGEQSRVREAVGSCPASVISAEEENRTELN